MIVRVHPCCTAFDLGTAAKGKLDVCHHAGMAVIVHLSDLHFGAQTVNLAESLLADVVNQRPDLIVVSGDFTQRARRDEFGRAEVFLKRLPGPVLRVVGNHDIPLFDLPRRFLAPTRRYQHYIDAELDPMVVVPGLVAVGLDTMPPMAMEVRPCLATAGRLLAGWLPG
jgi:Calcineurin-like phosphoesterase